MSDNHLPVHVAIIPDGNRRWAKGKGLKPWEGHEEGAKNTEKLVYKALDLGVKCLTFWGSSLENLKKRPLSEKRALLSIYEKYFSRLIESESVHKNKVKVNFIGHWEEQFPASLKKVIYKVIDRTKNYRERALNFMLAYNGDDEMIEAVKNIVKKSIAWKDITAEEIKRNLMTKDLPTVDLLIRTGGDPHLSVGFMMWDIANAQLFFSEKYYPDFSENALQEAIEEYQRREKRNGK
jgi:undecaprenyl diphosphate synthase